MVEANKKSVMVLGTLVVGKSKLLSRISGFDLEEDEPLESRMSATGCTQHPK